MKAELNDKKYVDETFRAVAITFGSSLSCIGWFCLATAIAAFALGETEIQHVVVAVVISLLALLGGFGILMISHKFNVQEQAEKGSEKNGKKSADARLLNWIPDAEALIFVALSLTFVLGLLLYLAARDMLSVSQSFFIVLWPLANIVLAASAMKNEDAKQAEKGAYWKRDDTGRKKYWDNVTVSGQEVCFLLHSVLLFTFLISIVGTPDFFVEISVVLALFASPFIWWIAPRFLFPKSSKTQSNTREPEKKMNFEMSSEENDNCVEEDIKEKSWSPYASFLYSCVRVSVLLFASVLLWLGSYHQTEVVTGLLAGEATPQYIVAFIINCVAIVAGIVGLVVSHKIETRAKAKKAEAGVDEDDAEKPILYWLPDLEVFIGTAIVLACPFGIALHSGTDVITLSESFFVMLWLMMGIALGIIVTKETFTSTDIQDTHWKWGVGEVISFLLFFSCCVMGVFMILLTILWFAGMLCEVLCEGHVIEASVMISLVAGCLASYCIVRVDKKEKKEKKVKKDKEETTSTATVDAAWHADGKCTEDDLVCTAASLARKAKELTSKMEQITQSVDKEEKISTPSSNNMDTKARLEQLAKINESPVSPFTRGVSQFSNAIECYQFIVAASGDDKKMEKSACDLVNRIKQNTAIVADTVILETETAAGICQGAGVESLLDANDELLSQLVTVANELIQNRVSAALDASYKVHRRVANDILKESQEETKGETSSCPNTIMIK